MRKASRDNSLRCSFCRKGQNTAGKLIANPSDYPRAYICDECVAMCAAIIEDDRGENDPAHSQEAEDALSENIPHPFLSHPLASTLMDAIESWIHEESLGKDGLIALNDVRAISSQMMSDMVNSRTGKTTRVQPERS